jgi:hypothetical protein
MRTLLTDRMELATAFAAHRISANASNLRKVPLLIRLHGDVDRL